MWLFCGLLHGSFSFLNTLLPSSKAVACQCYSSLSLLTGSWWEVCPPWKESQADMSENCRLCKKNTVSARILCLLLHCCFCFSYTMGWLTGAFKNSSTELQRLMQPLHTKLLLNRGWKPDPWVPRWQCLHHQHLFSSLVLRADQPSSGRWISCSARVC